jgi:MFS family permease
MGVVLVQTILVTMSRWLTELDPPAQRRSKWALAFIALFVVLGAALGAAVVASLCIHALGWILGALVFAVALYVLGLRRGGALRTLCRVLVGVAA